MTRGEPCPHCGASAEGDRRRCDRCGQLKGIAPHRERAADRGDRKVLRQGRTATSATTSPSQVAGTVGPRERPPEARWRSGAGGGREGRWSRRVVGAVLGVAVLAAGLGLLAVVWSNRERSGFAARVVVPEGVLHASRLFADLGRPRRMVDTGFLRGDAGGSIAVEVVPSGDDQPCEIVLDASPLFGRTVWSGVLSRSGRIHAIRPGIAWNPDALLTWRRPDIVEITGSVRIGDRAVPLRHAIRVRSVAEASLLEPRSFAAMINEDHAWIDPILREGIDHGVVDRYRLLEEEDFEGTVANVFSVWTAMRRRGIVYGNVAVTSNPTTQRVRTLDEVVRHRQANCVDGSVAMASMLRRLGVPSALVVRPNHMLLAFRPCRTCRWLGLETTLLSQDPVETRHPAMDSLRRRYARGDSTLAADWASFEAALVAGDANLPQDPDESGSMLRIDEIRDSGMIPVPTDRSVGSVPPSP